MDTQKRTEEALAGWQQSVFMQGNLRHVINKSRRREIAELEGRLSNHDGQILALVEAIKQLMDLTLSILELNFLQDSV